MADYNVNMKQWNGTSFDNVLPLAYNALALNGKNMWDIASSIFEIVNWVGDGASEHTKSFTASNPDIIIVAANSSLSFGSNSYTANVPVAVFTNNVTAIQNVTGLEKRQSLIETSVSISNKRVTFSSVDDSYYAFNKNGSKYSMIGIWLSN